MPARNLTIMPVPRDKASACPIRVVLYARVSSKDQEREGYSIPAQLRLLHEYAAHKGFVIDYEFTDVETAKESGRTNFGEMLAYLKKHLGACRTILVEKTDRLYRNIKDYATVDELNVEIHLVKENEVISRESKSSEQFVHGIKVLVARNYSLNLGEETIKGMKEKARTGIYPSYAPVGYRNADGTAGKRIIVPDPDDSPVIAELFERFATGHYSVRTLVKEHERRRFQPAGSQARQQYGPPDPKKADIHRRFRLGRHHLCRNSRAFGHARNLAARSGTAERPRPEQDAESEARLRVTPG